MIHRPSKRVFRPNFIPKYSDGDILKTMIHSKIWTMMFLGDKKAGWILLKALINLKMEMFAAPLRAWLRIHHGKRTVGVTIWLLSTTMMMAFNTDHIAGYLATFFPVVVPVLPFFLSPDQLYDGIFISVRSQAFLYFWIGYAVIAPFHLIQSFRRTKGNSHHGTALLHLVIGRHIGLSHIFSKAVLEPIFIGCIGGALIFYEIDFTFGLFLLIGAACVFFQETRNAVLRFTMR